MQSYDQLAEKLLKKANSLNEKDQFWLGIAGTPGSGKSTLADALKTRLKNIVTIIPQDGYHYYRSQLDIMENPTEVHKRRGAPFTFDAARLVDELVTAKKLGAGSFPSFDHKIGDPIENDIQLSPANKIIIVEGNYLLLNADPWCKLKQEVFDESWHLDVPVQVSNQRVAERHIKIGLSSVEAENRVKTNDGINAELIVKESPANADHLIKIF